MMKVKVRKVKVNVKVVQKNFSEEKNHPHDRLMVITCNSRLNCLI